MKINKRRKSEHHRQILLLIVLFSSGKRGPLIRFMAQQSQGIRFKLDAIRF